MPVYIVTGTHGVGKTTVLEKALKKKPMKVVTFGDVMFDITKGENLVESKDELRSKIPHDKYAEIQKKAGEEIAAMDNVIIDTHCSINTKKGYFPGLPANILKILKPKAIILIEASPEDIEKRRKGDESRKRSDFGGVTETAEHQHINRCFACAYSALTGALVTIIVNHQGKTDEAAEKLCEVLG